MTSRACFVASSKCSLYIDTSAGNVVGLLDSEFSWLSRKQSEKKASFVQESISELLEEKNFNFDDIEKVIYVAGPGSYTGMRITEGFIGLLGLKNIETHGFYHYNLPALKGIKDYCWISNAFKGEYFIFNSDGHKLLTSEKVIIYFEGMNNKIWSHDGKDFLGFSTISTQDLILNQPELLKKVNGNQKPYYYRPLELEFTKKKA